MPKFLSRLTLIVPILILLSSCLQPATETPAPAISLQHTETTEPLPTMPPGTREMIIFSMEENGYAHLFAYVPNELPLTRLTSDNWDDVAPAISPDGRHIAFASNRSGYWDLYLLDTSTTDVIPLTTTPDYEGAPSWSPDGSFLAFEAYRNDNLDILIGPAENPLQAAMLLTSSPAADHSPAWAPGGRQIAFISNGEVMLADLDKPDAERFANLSNTELATESHPVWSHDGTKLAWASSSQSVGQSGIYVWDANRNVPAEWIGDGDYPAWDPGSDEIITTYDAPNETFLVTYSPEGHILQPLSPFPASLQGVAWGNVVLANPLPNKFQQTARLTPPVLWQPNGEPISEGGSGRYSLIDLQNVQAPYPQISDRADEAFNALRNRVIEEVGWDALASLENAFVPITTALDPGFEEDWLYTGRAFAINSLMTNAGWMAAVREDFGAQTYWRLYLRSQVQDGSLGEPLHTNPWDLSARYNLDPKIYEQGGKYSNVPAGYWVDVTSLALQFGWERMPALPNWRTFYRGARFTEFAFTEDLDYYTALLQLYPPDILLTPTRLLPPTNTATITPTFTPSATASRTPRNPLTPSATRTPSLTPTPSRTPVTPTLSPTPPTVIP